MNDDFVRRSDILEFKRTLYRVRYGTGCQSIEDTEAVEVNDIESIPTADVQPVVIGQWVRPHYRNSVHCYNCSKCGAEAQHMEFRGVLKYYNKCPNCGADMRGGC